MHLIKIRVEQTAAAAADIAIAAAAVATIAAKWMNGFVSACTIW